MSYRRRFQSQPSIFFGLCAAASFLGVPALRAQSALALESVLSVERARDASERTRLAAQLARLRVHLDLKDASLEDFAAQLRLQVGGKTSFFVRSKDGTRDWERIHLRVRGQTMLQVLSIVQRTTKLRFVFRSGVVMLVHKDDYRPETTLRVYDLRMALHRVRDFPGRPIGIPVGDGERDEPEIRERSVTGLSAERIEEILRKMVRPESWGEIASLEIAGGICFVRQSPKGHREVARLLARLGVRVRELRPKRAVRAPSSKVSRRARR